MVDTSRRMYQLWCYYELNGEWKMERFFRSRDEAYSHLSSLRGCVETPCMTDWYVTTVEGWS